MREIKRIQNANLKIDKNMLTSITQYGTISNVVKCNLNFGGTNYVHFHG